VQVRTVGNWPGSVKNSWRLAWFRSEQLEAGPVQVRTVGGRSSSGKSVGDWPGSGKPSWRLAWFS